MEKNYRFLKYAAFIAVFLLVLFQIISVFYFDGYELSCDQRSYINSAKSCIEHGQWYPYNTRISYAFAPGYVNLLILYYKIFGTFFGFSFVNILMNLVILFEVYIISKKFFSEKTALIAIILFCITYSNWFVNIGFFTELPFVFCMMSAVAICVCTNKLRWYFFAGLLLAVGNWIRPLALAFLAGIFVLIFLGKIFVVRKSLILLVSTLAVAIAIGLFSKNYCGLFVFQSTTSGVNLAGSANYKANGLVGFSYRTDPFYLEKLPSDYNQLNFIQKDKILRNIAFKWIFEHPVKYIATVPLKSMVLFGFDTWSERFQFKDGLSQIRDGKNKENIVFYCVRLFLKSLVFYAIIALTIYYLWINRYSLFSYKNAMLWIAVFVIGLTLPFMVTDRYHYPIMPILWIYSAQAISQFISKKGVLPEKQSE